MPLKPNGAGVVGVSVVVGGSKMVDDEVEVFFLRPYDVWKAITSEAFEL